MKKARVPQAQLILTYHEFFDSSPPGDRVSLIKRISKDAMIHELAALNYRSKPSSSVVYDLSYETQLKELRYFWADDDVLKNKYYKVIREYREGNSHPIIFNRAANLFALEEIIYSSEIKSIPNFKWSIEAWDSFFKYYLAVNSIITKYVEPVAPQGSRLENLNAALIPLNEYNIEVDPLFIPYRGYKLMLFLLSHPDYKGPMEDYFARVLGVNLNDFFVELISMYLYYNKESTYGYFYKVPQSRKHLFEYFSTRIPKSSTEPLEFINLKKSPYYKEDDEVYLLLDNVFLLEKSYELFMNDFWFDYVKGLSNSSRSTYNISNYRSVIGFFFESYIEELVKEAFGFLRYPAPKLFSQLLSTLGDVEYADIYIRQNKQVLIGQAKSKGIYSREKYSRNAIDFFKNDRVAFYKDCGIDQLVTSIDYLYNT